MLEQFPPESAVVSPSAWIRHVDRGGGRDAQAADPMFAGRRRRARIHRRMSDLYWSRL